MLYRQNLYAESASIEVNKKTLFRVKQLKIFYFFFGKNNYKSLQKQIEKKGRFNFFNCFFV